MFQSLGKEIPKEFTALFEAETELAVMERARELITKSSIPEQASLLGNVAFLSIVNQALVGLDQYRDQELRALVNSFADLNKVNAANRFTLLLQATIH